MYRPVILRNLLGLKYFRKFQFAVKADQIEKSTQQNLLVEQIQWLDTKK